MCVCLAGGEVSDRARTPLESQILVMSEVLLDEDREISACASVSVRAYSTVWERVF